MEARKEIIHSYAHFDLLGNKTGDNILSVLINSTKRIVEQLIALVNALASDSAGRSYLLQ